MIYLFFAGAGFSVQIFAQSTERSIRENLRFANYLIETEQFADADYVLNKELHSSIGDKALLDSLCYFKGWVAYNQKKLSESAYFLQKVTTQSPLYYKSRFYCAYDWLFQNKIDSATAILNEINPDSSKLIELRSFEMAGISLLARDYASYKRCQKSFSYTYYELVKEEQLLDHVMEAHKIFKPKSIFLAGMFSAVIPGSGKIYLGKVGEGISALFANAILAGITIENYKNRGISNYKTIAFGSLFAIFYVGNIYGSMVSVNVYRNEFYKSYDRKILFNLHIPLRNIFR